MEKDKDNSLVEDLYKLGLMERLFILEIPNKSKITIRDFKSGKDIIDKIEHFSEIEPYYFLCYVPSNSVITIDIITENNLRYFAIQICDRDDNIHICNLSSGNFSRQSEA